jgi:hypothetical protein
MYPFRMGIPSAERQRAYRERKKAAGIKIGFIAPDRSKAERIAVLCLEKTREFWNEETAAFYTAVEHYIRDYRP